MASEQTSRRWFHLTIREIVLLIVAAGFAAGWLHEIYTWLPVRSTVRLVPGETTWVQGFGKFDGVTFKVIAATDDYWAIQPPFEYGIVERGILTAFSDKDECAVKLFGSGEGWPAFLDTGALRAEHGPIYDVKLGREVRVRRFLPSQPVAIIWIDQEDPKEPE